MSGKARNWPVFIDEMLAAASRAAALWRDNAPLPGHAEEIGRIQKARSELLAALPQPAPVRAAVEALQACQTHIAGYHLRHDEDAKRLLDEMFNELQRIHSVARKALASLRERPTDGWVLVPKEPTEAMLSTGWLVAPGEDRVARARYAAMLAAAAPPSSSTGEVG